MNITILTYGSRGDVQPFIPLSLGLISRGHSVKLAAPARFQPLAKEEQIPFVPLAGEPEELIRLLNNSGGNVLKTVHGIMDHAIEIGADIMQQADEACEDADLVIHTFMHCVGAHTLAREKGIPDIHIQLFPMFTPTGDYPNISLPGMKIRSLNRWTHKVSHQIAFWTSRFGYERVRRRAGLPRRKLYSPFVRDPARLPTPVLCAWSPIVIPPSSDWTPTVHVTGYLFGKHDVGYQAPEQLQQFLDSGDVPICVSFGSMVNRDAEKIDGMIRQALRQTHDRVIVLSGWSDVKHASSRDILYTEAVPHQWLLPRCSMIIHHGGAGTTSAGLRAGIPNIVIPHTADQPFWGSRVYSIGAGPKPIPVKRLSVENLTRAIAEGHNSMIRKRAEVISRQLSREDGVGTSVQRIEKFSDDFFRKNR